jgi:hypothetical protein
LTCGTCIEGTADNEQQTTDDRQQRKDGGFDGDGTRNGGRQIASSKQQTANSKQQTANSKQQTHALLDASGDGVHVID